MAVYTKKTPWPIITEAVQRSKGRVLAAIGYVSTGAIDQLPLKEGDILVCDASEGNIRNGSTDPRALLPFLNRKVKVFSKPGLHAKVVVTRRRAFVGSANASSNSRHNLFEAVMDTTDSNQIAELREFINEISVRPISKRDIDRLSALVPKRDRQVVRAVDPAQLPQTVTSLVLVDLTNDEEWSAQEVRAHEKGKVPAQQTARTIATSYTLEEFALSRDEAARFREGDWVVQVVDQKPLSPGWVVHIGTFGKRGVIWLACPREIDDLTHIDDLDLKRKFGPREIRRVRQVEANRIIKLFK